MKCHTCKKQIADTKSFCSKRCFFSRKNYRNHSEETKRKIAIGNSKPFTNERKRAISDARTFKPAEELINNLQSYWKLRYLNPCVIAELCGLKNHKAIYVKLVKEHCKIEQLKFMPKNWYPCHYEKLLELGSQNVYYKDIAKVLGFGSKQVYAIALKLNLRLNRRDPNAWQCVTSKPEKLVCEWLNNSGYQLDMQFPLGNFFFDARIQNTNVLIEVNGDYWHCNPKVYVNGPINEMQKAHIRRDFAKKAYASKMGYYLITLWELDLKQKPVEMNQWLLKKVREHAT
jgi:G:T-mismatch repair DNA endonuclease (very short patch repair protein)